METSALLSMIILLTASWGGFITCLILAIKKEGQKQNQSAKKFN